MNLYELPIHILHDMRMKGEIATEEIVRSVLDRIDRTEERLHCFLYLSGERMVDRARQIDGRIGKGEEVHPLAGMPIAVKDLFSTKGIETTCGSKYLENYIPPFESTVTQKLENADYNLAGKSNMDEFAMGSSTEHSAFGPTRNPYDLERVPGGSSGGSAAAVAAGEALGAVGSDTGGSIRQPSAFTSVVGLKPTYGRISRWGMVAFASSFDQAGPITKDVEDAALLLKTIAGFDKLDATSLNVGVPDYGGALHRSVKGMKVGLIGDLDLRSCDAEIVRIFQNNLKVLADGGAEIVEVSIPAITHAIAAYYIIAMSEASSNLGRYDGIRFGQRRAGSKDLRSMYEESREKGLGKEVKLRILLGTFALSAGYYDAYYIKAQKIQSLIRSQFYDALSTVDVLALPVSPTPPFKLGEKTDDPLQMYLMDVFTISANLAGIPGISVPGGATETGLPVGFQMLSGHLMEEKLFRAAHYFETANDSTKPPLAV